MTELSRNKPQLTVKKVIVVILALVALAYLADKCSGALRPSIFDDPDLHSKQMAWEVSKSFVKSKLLSSSSADFPSYFDIKVEKNNDTYIINGFVTSKNVYGVEIRNNYIVIVEQVTDKFETFKLKSLRFY